MDPACAYPAIDVVAGTPACAMCLQAATHPEAYARRPPVIFRRMDPAPIRRRYVNGGNPQSEIRNPKFTCLLCGAASGPLGLCREHVDGWRKHNRHHPLDHITAAQYAARRAAC
jgi:hypothetical protein